MPKMSPNVTIGTFGEIKRLLKTLSKRDLHADMEFLCGPANHPLKCHRFIIGAQSEFLKAIMQASVSADGSCQIYLPDIDPKHMEVVLQFLYTGKMKLCGAQVSPVRDLLQSILKIDADFKLPYGDAIPGLSNNTNSKDDEDRDRNGGPSPPSPNDGSPENEGSAAPPKKRFRINSNTSSNSTKPNSNNTSHSIHNSYNMPMSPPHHLEAIPSDEEEIQVFSPPPKSPPPTVDLSEPEDSGAVKIEFNSELETMEDPDVTTNKSSRSIATEERNTNVKKSFDQLTLPTAPKIIAKSTGGGKRHVAKKSTTSFGKKNHQKTSPNKDISNTGDTSKDTRNLYDIARNNLKLLTNLVEEDEDSADHSNQEDFAFAECSGQNDETNYHGPKEEPEESTEVVRRSDRPITRMVYDEDDFDPDYVDEEPTTSYYEPRHLPPPIPEAPEPGLVIYRGEWMKQSKVDRIMAQREINNQNRIDTVRKYHPNMHTVKGIPNTQNSEYINQAPGVYECVECGAKYESVRSLECHFKRAHNQNSHFDCPEGCGKKLASKSAIKKHLLSHRPQHEWPFRCEFCGKHFQARADLPKHYHTSVHKNDPRIPPEGSSEWHALLKRAKVINWDPSKTKPSRSAASTSTTAPPVFVDTGAPSEHEETSDQVIVITYDEDGGLTYSQQPAPT